MQLNSRIELAQYFKQLGFQRGIEVGVADGRYSEILCQAIPGLKLICVDPWAPYDGNWRSQQDQDTAFNTALERLKQYDADLLKRKSEDAAIITDDESQDFVFIDGAHDYENVLLDITVWTPKVRKGGIVAGHDYYESPRGTVQVIPAVDKYVKENGIKLNIIPRYEFGHKDDKAPCWWFVKE